MAYLYLIILALMVVNNYYLNYRLEIDHYINLLIYYSLAVAAIFTTYQTKSQKMLLAVIILLLCLSANIYLYIPALALIPFIVSKETTKKVKIISGLIMGISILLIICGFVLSSFFDKPSVIDKKVISPDNQKVIKSTYYYLGTDLDVRFEQRLFYNKVKISRTLYITNAENEVDMKWLDNNTVFINNQRINIYSSLMKTGYE